MAADPLDLERLEAVARAATPGPWEVFAGEHGRARRYWDVVKPDAQGGERDIAEVLGPFDPQNAEHIAAFNPATALALIAALRAEQARVREAEMERDRCDAGLGALLHQRTKLEAERDALQAEVRALREQVKGLETLRAALPERYHKGYPRIAGSDRWALHEPMVDAEWLEGVKAILAALSPSSDAKEPRP